MMVGIFGSTVRVLVVSASNSGIYLGFPLMTFLVGSIVILVGTSFSSGACRINFGCFDALLNIFINCLSTS